MERSSDLRLGVPVHASPPVIPPNDGRQRAAPVRVSSCRRFHDAFTSDSRPRPPGCLSPVTRPSDIAFPSCDEFWTPKMSCRPSFRCRPRPPGVAAKSSVSGRPRRRFRSRRREDQHPLHIASKELRRCRSPAEGRSTVIYQEKMPTSNAGLMLCNFTSDLFKRANVSAAPRRGRVATSNQTGNDVV